MLLNLQHRQSQIKHREMPDAVLKILLSMQRRKGHHPGCRHWLTNFTLVVTSTRSYLTEKPSKDRRRKPNTPYLVCSAHWMQKQRLHKATSGGGILSDVDSVTLLDFYQSCYHRVGKITRWRVWRRRRAIGGRYLMLYVALVRHQASARVGPRANNGRRSPTTNSHSRACEVRPSSPYR